MRKIIALGLVFGALAAAAAVAGVLLTADSAPPSATGSSRIIIVSSAAGALPLDESALASHGATAVNSWSNAAAAADDTTKVIIFAGPDALASADAKWVTDRMDRIGEGFGVGGLNVSQVELAAAFEQFGGWPLDDRSRFEGWPLDDGSRFGDQPFFSLMYSERPTYSSRGGGGTSQELDSADQFLRYLDDWITIKLDDKAGNAEIRLQ